MNRTERDIALFRRVISRLKEDLQLHIYTTLEHAGTKEGSSAAFNLMRRLIEQSLTGKRRQRQQLVRHWRFFTNAERRQLRAVFGLNFFGSKKYSPYKMIRHGQSRLTCQEWLGLLLISLLFGMGVCWILAVSAHHGWVVLGIMVMMLTFGLGVFGLRDYKRKPRS
jgi:hypothetical protein